MGAYVAQDFLAAPTQMFAAVLQIGASGLARNPCKGHLRAIRVDSNSDEMVVELENCRSILDFNTHLLAKCKGEIKSVTN